MSEETPALPKIAEDIPESDIPGTPEHTEKTIRVERRRILDSLTDPETGRLTGRL